MSQKEHLKLNLSEPRAEIKEIRAIYSNYVLPFGGDVCQTSNE